MLIHQLFSVQKISIAEENGNVKQEPVEENSATALKVHDKTNIVKQITPEACTKLYTEGKIKKVLTTADGLVW